MNADSRSPETAVAVPERVPWARYLLATAAMPAAVVVGVAIPRIKLQCGVSDDFYGTITAVANVVAGGAGLAVAYAADRYDLRASTVVCLIVGSLASAALCIMPTSAALLTMMWCVAAAGTVISQGTFYKLFRGTRKGDSAILRFNLLGASISTLSPLVVGGLLWLGAVATGEEIGWRWVTFVVAALQIGWIWVIVRSPRETVAVQTRPAWPAYRALLVRRRSYSLMLLAALHVGGDVGASTWLVLMAKERFHEIGDVKLGLLLGTVSFSYAVGRWVQMSVIGRTLGLRHVAALTTLGAGLLALSVFWAPTYWMMLVLTWVTWLCLSANWPTLNSCGAKWFPQTPAAAMGVMGATQWLGAAVACKLVGMIGERTGHLTSGFWVCIAMFLGFAALAAVLGTLVKPEPAASEA